MSHVRVGDAVLSFNGATGRAEFTKVRAWLHRVSHAEALFVKISTNASTILASPTHNLAVGTPHTYAFARDIQVGDTLFSSNGMVVVTSSSVEVARGLYAPLTWTSNVYVSMEGSTSFFLAHSMAGVRTHFAVLVHTLLGATAFLSPYMHDVDDNDETDYLHPIARMFWSIAGVQFDHMVDVGTQTHSVHPIGMLVSAIAGV